MKIIISRPAIVQATAKIQSDWIRINRPYATSAVRDAANRDEFLKRVKRETGFDVEVISGEEEARRTLLGIRSGLPIGVTDILALDIGGGSTEFILDRRGQKPITDRYRSRPPLRAAVASRPADQ